ncbi:MAG: glutaminase, partial [Cyanobium sp.]
DLAVMAATLACQGRQPLSGERLLSRDSAIRMLALMGTCGMYDYAGHWLHDVGMPAKSGVAGGVLAVVPGRLGLAVWSPRLDRYGNSVRGIAVCEELSRRLGLHLYDQNPADRDPIRRRSHGGERQSRRWRAAPEAARLRAAGERLQVLQVQGLLDFTACEQLLTSLEGLAASADLVVLDLGRVVQVEPSCGPLLHRQFARLAASGTELLLCRADALAPGPEGAGPSRHANLDRALEAAEDLLLERLRHEQGSTASEAAPSGLLETLPSEARARILPLLECRPFTAGETVMRHGDPSDSLYIAREGLFESSLYLGADRGDAAAGARLATFTPGMAFGEIGFLSGRPRTADVVCCHGGSCWVLNRPGYEDLRREDPHTALALYRAILEDLGTKLARASLQLTLMELH